MHRRAELKGGRQAVFFVSAVEAGQKALTKQILPRLHLQHMAEKTKWWSIDDPREYFRLTLRSRTSTAEGTNGHVLHNRKGFNLPKCPQVCDLAQALRDGVLLCQLLNNLLPQAVNLREINLRPQMSQFLCLKNIRTFLGVCQERFNLKKSELFEAFDLFDVRDFAKVIDTLSILSHSSIAIQRGLQPFPLEGCAPDDEIYSGLSDQIDYTKDSSSPIQSVECMLSKVHVNYKMFK
ncbi:hypothetical protein INR49_008301 [Caranx melampygus]|nr:hypothetical protein INR49_008301 [Caranx melampygus]